MIDHQPLSERDHSQLPDVARTRMRIQGHTGGKPLDPMNCIPWYPEKEIIDLPRRPSSSDSIWGTFSADLIPIDINVFVRTKKSCQFSSFWWRFSNHSFRTESRRGRVATITHFFWESISISSDSRGVIAYDRVGPTWWYSKVMCRIPLGVRSNEFWNLSWMIFSTSWACPASVCKRDLVVSRTAPSCVFSDLYKARAPGVRYTTRQAGLCVDLLDMMNESNRDSFTWRLRVTS